MSGEMKNDDYIKTMAFISNVILVSDKFIDKVETGRARSVETYAELKDLKSKAEALQREIK